MVKAFRPWRGERVLVTGATGLVGSALTRKLLQAGAEVVALVMDVDPLSPFFREGMDRSVKIVRGRLEEFETVLQAIGGERTATVFHVAAQALVEEGVRDPLGTFEANIRGTTHILEACRRHAPIVERLVCASSDKAYGSSPVLPYTEDMPLRGLHPYDASKSCMDLLTQTYCNTYGTPACIARCGNIYGPGDLHWSRLIPGTIQSLLKGERPIVRSDGTCTRDYLYVEDVVDGYLAIADNMHRPEVCGQAFNLGPTKPLSVMEVVQAVTRVMDRTDLKPDIRNTARNEIHHQSLSGAKIKKLLDWTPAHSLEVGLRKTVPWYLEVLGSPTSHA